MTKMRHTKMIHRVREPQGWQMYSGNLPGKESLVFPSTLKG